MRKWVPLVAICLGAFILLVDITIVNVALPRMATDLHVTFTSLQWVVDAYTLVLAALLLVTGSIADAYGRRRFYVIGLAVFALASLACALAGNGDALIAARAVQGIGGAAMFATSPALIIASYSGRDRGTAFGIWGAVNGAAAAIGPLLGGVLTQHYGWQAIFLVNLPIAAVAIGLSLRALPADSPVRTAASRIDLPGAAAFTVSAGAVTYALIRGGETSWSASSTIVAFIVAAVALIAFLVIERLVADPMLDLTLFRNRGFSGLMAGAVLLQAGAFGSLVLVSLWLQSLLGLSPIRAGLALTPLAVASFITAAVAGRFTQRISPSLPVGAGLLAVAAGMVLLRTEMTTGAGANSLIIGLVVTGVGVGLATPVVVSAAVGTLPPHRMGMAGGVVNTFRQLGFTLGIAVFGAIFVGHAQTAFTGTLPDAHGAALALSAGQAHSLDAAVPAEQLHHAFASGLDLVFVWAAVAAALGGLVVLLLVRNRPQHGDTAPPAPRVAEPAAVDAG